MTQQPKDKSLGRVTVGVSIAQLDRNTRDPLSYITLTLDSARDLHHQLGELLGEVEPISLEAAHRQRSKRIQKELRDGVCSHGTRVTMGCVACNEMNRALFDRTKP